jgi:predicted Zn-dependent protease with MMP-like domain
MWHLKVKEESMMTAKAVSRQEIIMNFSTPPNSDDVAVFAREALENLPDELSVKCEDLILEVEEFPDDAIMQDMELETPYELLALYHSAKEISPGVQKKIANGEDKIVLYRRPILDVWCETGEDLGRLIREIMIEELARGFEFSDDDIQEMILSLRQG